MHESIPACSHAGVLENRDSTAAIITPLPPACSNATNLMVFLRGWNDVMV